MRTQRYSKTPTIPRKLPRRKSRSLEGQHQLMAVEIGLKLAVYLLMSGTAIVTIIKLLPYQQVQQEKLAEVRYAVQQTEIRVDDLKEKFNRNFDPSQSRQVMQEQSPRRDPNQRRIFWLESQQ